MKKVLECAPRSYCWEWALANGATPPAKRAGAIRLLPLRLPNRAADPQGASEKVRLKIMPLGAYAPYVIERFTKLEGSELSLYYVLSTWNPYVVVLMKSRLRVE
jgi:hypothetical protein